MLTASQDDECSCKGSSAACGIIITFALTPATLVIGIALLLILDRKHRTLIRIKSVRYIRSHGAQGFAGKDLPPMPVLSVMHNVRGSQLPELTWPTRSRPWWLWPSGPATIFYVVSHLLPSSRTSRSGIRNQKAATRSMAITAVINGGNDLACAASGPIPSHLFEDQYPANTNGRANEKAVIVKGSAARYRTTHARYCNLELFSRVPTARKEFEHVPATEISYRHYTCRRRIPAHSASDGSQISEGTYTFGIAMPATASSDFIGRISSQGNAGWAGISLGGPMRGSLMVVARPNEGAVIGSLRLATGYANPGVYSGAATLEIIAEGTAYDTESTNFTMTFLCKGCLQGDDSTFAAADATTNLGWATSSVDVTTPADASTVLGYHDTGFGLFAVDLAAAQSASFAEWAALASQSYSNSPATPTNPTAGGGANGYGNNTAPATPPTVSNTTYDYIVIGSGPSGLISSQRLTETGKSVLLIERGMATTFSSGGERFVPWNNSLTYYDVPGVWGFMNEGTQGEAYCTDTAAIAGCALGGGGAVNAMAFIRPANFDFDDKWPETWKSADLAPAAERLYSRNPGTTIPSNDGISYDNATQAVLEPFFEQNGWSNTDYVNDPDSKDQVYGLPSLNVANGLRSGPIHTYLPLAQAKPDFTLALHTKVIRILRNASTITGVEVENASGREIINLNPSGAVILAAGSMSTPRLLFNSGIGPTEQINIVKSSPTGVTVPESDWISLPVGVGIKDHSTYALIFNVTGGITARSREEVMNPSELDLSLYQTGSGVLAHSQQRLDVFRKINMTDGHTIGFQMHCMSVNVNDTITCQAFETHGLTSAGVLGIKPDQATYFTKEPWANNDVDRKAWEMFIDEVFEMARQPGSPLVYSGGAEMTAAEYLAASKVSNGYHVVGSTKMGSDDGRRNGTAVVDLDTKVYGTDNLFIVDASFHPDLPTGNTQAQVMVAAERAIERIIALRGETWSPTGGYSQGTPPPTGYTPATPPTGEKSNGSPEDTPPTGEKTNGYPQATSPEYCCEFEFHILNWRAT
ncbi:choline dehydrogenase [Drepanopeziza brunnea f. sp. 'multigermtubi' MB_m1]|uniref:Choline dehydrogenase n=1 Tax=Marssonina brunnea f. sp. multigermtubi (strain MB_m1) TaxID=1072389 RepID=K1WP77_MARBU|nr:choline dehydrogenase [Drepanopeziza brunnea f. sp. 'multigermtubi' MB_m1]EKD14751.1 choline dehydrogenase [Drepanopeziza brunnea f. sp. 'multigermtubi' MB_m1]